MNSLAGLFAAPWRHGAILKQFLRRDILGRYRGSLFGITWAFIQPILMLTVYTFVFVGIFKTRWAGAEGAGEVGFALRLFAGLLVFGLFSEVMGRAANLVVDQPSLVKKVVFPLELLPFVALGSALFHFALSCFILVLALAVLGQGIPLTTLLLPVVVLPLLPLLLGLGLGLAAIGVFVRDLGPIVALSMNVFLFLSPVFYSIQSLPANWQAWMHLNPLTPVIENVRLVIFAGSGPDWSSWGLGLGVGLLATMAGLWIFRALQDGFADVL